MAVEVLRISTVENLEHGAQGDGGEHGEILSVFSSNYKFSVPGDV
jgi:hypothetical protein